MVSRAAKLLFALCVLHMLVLGFDALSSVRSWLSLELWTWEHWKPSPLQSPALVLSTNAFWATVASFAVPLGVLCALIVHLDRRGIAIPRFVGTSLLIWALVCAALIELSGFLLAIVPTAMLVAATSRRAPGERARQSAAAHG